MRRTAVALALAMSSALSPGSAVPKFALSSHAGATVTEAAASKYILWFYPKADTGGCTAEGLAFTELHDSFREKGFDAIFGVSTDSVAANADFHEKFAFSFPLLCDVDRSLTRAFGCCTPSGDDPCAMSARVCAVVVDGKIDKYIDPFDARTGPKALLDAL